VSGERRLWLARHAAPMVPAGTCYGASDVPADAQATQEAAAALAASLPPALEVLSSPLARCRVLAEALHALRPDLPWRADPRLAEMDFGRWEGRPWDRVARLEFDRWMADFPGWRCGGGECVAQLMARVGAAFEETRRAARGRLWITHAGVVRAARLLARGVPLPREAGDWPGDELAFGAAVCLPLASG